MKSRFKQALELFGWQGGTIHQVNREFELTLGLPLRSVNIHNMSETDFWDMCADTEAVMQEHKAG